VSDAVRIGILGDFNADFPLAPCHSGFPATRARKLHMKVESEWLPTPSLTAETAEKTLEKFDGLWAAPGSPYKSFDGMLKGIEFARRRDWPFLGTCGGFQYAFIEFARNVLNIQTRTARRTIPAQRTSSSIRWPAPCPAARATPPKLSGRSRSSPAPGSYLQSFYEKDKTDRDPRNSSATSEVNPEFEWPLWKRDSPVVARGAQGEVRAIESRRTRFFLATLFQPQLSSTEKEADPSFWPSCKPPPTGGRKKLDDSVLSSAP